MNLIQETITDKTDQDTDNQTSYTTNYTYDALDRIIKHKDPNNGGSPLVSEFEYDVRNNLTKLTDPQDNVTEYVYNTQDRLTSKTVTPHNSATASKVVQFTYNDKNQVTHETTVTNPGYTVIHEYDAQGNRIRTTYPNDTSETGL